MANIHIGNLDIQKALVTIPSMPDEVQSIWLGPVKVWENDSRVPLKQFTLADDGVEISTITSLTFE